MTENAHQLELVGDALQTAWRRDHSAHRPARVARRRLVLAVALAMLVVGGGAAIASTILKNASDEQNGMVEGYRLFAGSQPHCVSTSTTSFRCALATPPTGETFFNADGSQASNVFLGMKVETVDASKHVDGGCVGASADGLAWDCYLGQAAVDHGIINGSYLGTFLPEPPTA